MKKVFYILILCFISREVSSAQVKDSTKSSADRNDSVHAYVEVMPEYPGGEEALMKYLAANINYPAMALDNNVQGKVIIEFEVDTNGTIVNLSVKKSIGFGCDEEAMRVVKAMPKWKPGMQDGKNVRVTYLLPIKFSIRGDTPRKKKHKE